MVLTPRPIDLAETLPRTIRHASDCAQFGGVRVLVRELPSVQTVEVPGGLSHFWLGYRPVPQEPGRMVFECQQSRRTYLVEHNPLFLAPSARFTADWQGAEGLVAHFQFQPVFLEDVAASLRLDPGSLHQTAMQKVRIDEPLESLCRLLMQEVEQGCPHDSPFFEALSRALAAALVRRVAVARAALGRDPRIERAVRLFEQRNREKVSMEEAMQVADLSRYQFFRRFRAAVGVSPHEYLLQCRLRLARGLILSEGNRRSLADIATEAGFYDQAHLCRHFRRVFGQSPGRLLRLH